MQNHCISSIFNSNQCDTHVLFVFFSDYSYKEGDCFEVLKGEQLKSCPLILLLNRSHYADEIIDLFISSSTIFLSSSLSLSLSLSVCLMLAYIGCISIDTLQMKYERCVVVVTRFLLHTSTSSSV